jgi:hypothetical protein
MLHYSQSMNANLNQTESADITYLRAEAACPRALRRAIVCGVFAAHDAAWSDRATDAIQALWVACALRGIDSDVVCAIVAYNVELGTVDASF